MNVINPLKVLTKKSWFFEQQVYDPEGIARAIKSTDGSGNVPKVLEFQDACYIMPNPHKKYGELRICDTVSPSILSTDYKSPPLIIETWK